MTDLNTDRTADTRTAGHRCPTTMESAPAYSAHWNARGIAGIVGPMLVRWGTRSAPLFRHTGHKSSCRSGAVGGAHRRLLPLASCR